MNSREPHCRYLGTCGGCLDERQNQSIVSGSPLYQQAVACLSPLFSEAMVEGELVTADRQGYRYRCEFRVRVDSTGRWHVGYFAAGSRDFIAVDTCAVLTPQLQAFHAFLNQLCVSELANQAFRLRLQALAVAGGGILVTIAAAALSHIGAIKRAILPYDEVLWCGAQGEGAPLVQVDRQDGVKFFTVGDMFQQAHLTLNRSLRRYIVNCHDKVIRASPEVTRVLDLYAGNGNLSLLLAANAAVVNGVEQDRRCVLAAQQGAAGYPAHFECSDAAAWLLKQNDLRNALLIVDPPRVGLGALAENLSKIQWRWMIYVSCASKSLQRDLKFFQTKGIKVTLRDWAVFDMYPYTSHYELVVLLERGAKDDARN